MRCAAAVMAAAAAVLCLLAARDQATHRAHAPAAAEAEVRPLADASPPALASRLPPPLPPVPVVTPLPIRESRDGVKVMSLRGATHLRLALDAGTYRLEDLHYVVALDVAGGGMERTVIEGWERAASLKTVQLSDLTVEGGLVLGKASTVLNRVRFRDWEREAVAGGRDVECTDCEFLIADGNGRFAFFGTDRVSCTRCLFADMWAVLADDEHSTSEFDGCDFANVGFLRARGAAVVRDSRVRTGPPEKSLRQRRDEWLRQSSAVVEDTIFEPGVCWTRARQLLDVLASLPASDRVTSVRIPRPRRGSAPWFEVQDRDFVFEGGSLRPWHGDGPVSMSWRGRRLRASHKPCNSDLRAALDRIRLDPDLPIDALQLVVERDTGRALVLAGRQCFRPSLWSSTWQRRLHEVAAWDAFTGTPVATVE